MKTTNNDTHNFSTDKEQKPNIGTIDKDKVINSYENEHDALYTAAANGDLLRVQDLIKQGVNVDVKNEKDITPLHLAAIYNHKEVVEVLLINKANPNTQSSFGDTPMHNAAYKSNLEIIQLLAQYGGNVNAVNIHGKSVLHAAASGIINVKEKWEMIKWLLDNDADYNAKTLGGVSVKDMFEQRDWSYAEHYDKLLKSFLVGDHSDNFYDNE